MIHSLPFPSGGTAGLLKKREEQIEAYDRRGYDVTELTKVQYSFRKNYNFIFQPKSTRQKQQDNKCNRIHCRPSSELDLEYPEQHPLYLNNYKTGSLHLSGCQILLVSLLSCFYIKSKLIPFNQAGFLDHFKD